MIDFASIGVLWTVAGAALLVGCAVGSLLSTQARADERAQAAADRLIAEAAEKLFENWWTSKRSLGPGRNTVQCSVIDSIEHLGSVIIDERGDDYLEVLVETASLCPNLDLRVQRQKELLRKERLEE